MPIIRSRPSADPFARVSKAVLKDQRLSWRAKGIFAYLIGQPADWIVRTEDVIKQSKEGRDAVRAAFMELAKAGYAELVTERDANGALQGKAWVLHDVTDRKTDSQALGTEALENRLSGKPSVGESAPTKNESSTKKDSTKKERTPPSPKTVEQIVAELEATHAYDGLDIAREICRMKAWLLTPKGRGRKLTAGFIVNWLNKCDLPLATGHGHIPKLVPSKITVAPEFKEWAVRQYPAKQPEIERYQTWADVPEYLRLEWKRQMIHPLTDLLVA